MLKDGFQDVISVDRLKPFYQCLNDNSETNMLNREPPLEQQQELDILEWPLLPSRPKRKTKPPDRLGFAQE